MCNCSPGYPRPRGEYGIISPASGAHWGLPPPTRGIQDGVAGLRGVCGTTPAHAGNPCHRHLSECPSQGLPPPTRGTRPCDRRCTCRKRPTPAHAGNPPQPSAPKQALAAYPRPRGESHLLKPASYTQTGLPPPTRGTPAITSLLTRPSGTIPARAGNPSAVFAGVSRYPDYPRPRGEPAFC